MDARDGVNESERITRTQGDQQTSTDRMETTRGGGLGVGGNVGRGNTGSRPGRGSGLGLYGNAQPTNKTFKVRIANFIDSQRFFEFCLRN